MAAEAAVSGGQYMGALSVVPDLIPYAATLTVDVTQGTHFRIVLSGAMTLANPTGMVDGQKITWELIQDATGGRVLTLGSAFKFGTDITSATLSTGINKRDFLATVYSSTTQLHYVVGFLRGF